MTSPVQGRAVCFTGKLEKMTRNQAHESARKLGAVVKTAVSGKVDLLVVAPGAGRKVRQAENLGIRMISEQEWFEFCALTTDEQAIFFKLKWSWM